MPRPGLWGRTFCDPSGGRGGSSGPRGARGVGPNYLLLGTPVPLEEIASDGMHDGMATMTHRTTFALDEVTALRLKRLADRWQVSQAEVVRRSLEKAEQQAELQQSDPLEMRRALFAAGKGLDAGLAGTYIAEVYQDRKRWRGE